MAETFKSAMRAYEPVVVPLLWADMVVALWLVWDAKAPNLTKALAFVLATAVMWLMTIGICAVFAAKDLGGA